MTSSIEANEQTIQAEDLCLADLLNLDVSSVAFFPISAIKAPGTILVLPTSTFNKFPLLSLEELIDQKIPGMIITPNQQYGPVLGARGLSLDNSAKTLVMLDGQSMNMRRHFGYGPMFRLPFLGDIKNIEVIQGPGAIMHGSGALNGFINLVPKNGAEFQGLQTNFTVGEKDGQVNIQAGYGKEFSKGKDLFVFGGFAIADGFKPDSDYGQIQYEKDYKRWTDNMTEIKVWAFPKPTYKIAAYSRYDNLITNIFFQRIQMTNNTLYGGNYADDRTYLDCDMLGINPKYNMPIADDHDIELTLAAELSDFSIASTRGSASINQRNMPFTIIDSAGDTLRGFVVDTNYFARKGGSEAHYEGKLTYRTTAIPYQQLAAGFLGGKRIFNKDKNYFQSETQNYTSLESVNSTWREVAIFGEDIFTFDNVTASLGARWDRIMFDSFPLPDIPSQIVKPKDADHFSPRLAAAFTIVPGQVIKGSYQEGFHYPDAAFFSSGLFVNAELRSGKVVNYVNDTTIHPTMPDTTIIMNFSTQLPLLKPEILKSIEVNYHGEFFSKLFFDAAVYYNAFKDLLLWKSFRAYEPDLLPSAAVAAFRRMHGFAGAFINAPFDVKILGCEFNAKAIPLDIKAITIETNASINYNKPIDMDRSSNAERAMHELFPSTLVKFGLDCQLFSKRVFVGCNGTYNPAIEMEDKKWFIYDCIKDNDRLVLNGAVGYVFSEKASAKLHCLNILENNIPLPPSGHLGTDVRKIYLQASWNF